MSNYERRSLLCSVNASRTPLTGVEVAGNQAAGDKVYRWAVLHLPSPLDSRRGRSSGSDGS